jgi:hypothetical protein
MLHPSSLDDRWILSRRAGRTSILPSGLRPLTRNRLGEVSGIAGAGSRRFVHPAPGPHASPCEPTGAPLISSYGRSATATPETPPAPPGFGSTPRSHKETDPRNASPWISPARLSNRAPPERSRSNPEPPPLAPSSRRSNALCETFRDNLLYPDTPRTHRRRGLELVPGLWVICLHQLRPCIPTIGIHDKRRDLAIPAKRQHPREEGRYQKACDKGGNA